MRGSFASRETLAPLNVKKVSSYIGPHKLFVEGWTPAEHTDRPPILCVGGAFDGSWIYSRFTKLMATMGWPTYAMNPRGYYKSAWKDVASLTVEDYVSDILAVKKGLHMQSPVIVGYSTGGVLAQKAVERAGAQALILYDSDPSKEIAIQSGLKKSHEQIPPVVEFWPDKSIVEEMHRRRVTDKEYKHYLSLFKQTRLSGRAYREIEVERVSIGRISCPVLILSIKRNPPHETMFYKRGASWYIFEGASHGSLHLSEDADRITSMAAGWLKSGCPLRRRKVFRTVTIKDDKPTGLLAGGGSFRGKESRRIAERSGSHLIVTDEGVLTHLHYWSGWPAATVKVVQGKNEFDVPMKRIGKGREPGESLFEAFFEMTFKRGFYLYHGDDQDRPRPGSLYRPELKDLYLKDGVFYSYKPAPKETPPQFIDRTFYSHELEHNFKVRVMLPRNYNPAFTYPVAVLNDGQNQWTGEGFHGGWHTDSEADDLVHAGQMREIILVGIECHHFRNRAYLPPPIAKADRYVDFVADHILPELRRDYRISTNPSEIAIIGSSYGANNSVYAGLYRPDVFGLVGALSFAYIHANPQIRAIERATRRPFRKIYIDSGTRWDDDQPNRDDYTVITKKLVEACSKKWMTHGKNLLGLVAEGHHHNEYYWRKRIRGCLRFLFRQE